MPTTLFLNFPQSNQPAYQVTSDKEVIAGRAPTCDVDLVRCLQGNLAAVSREHFRIFHRKDEGFVIVDISYNGTQVNEDFLTKGRPRILRDGDIIKLAKDNRLIIRVAIDEDPEITVTIGDPDEYFQPLDSGDGPDLYFDEAASQFVVDGRPVPHEHLTRLEVSLLKYLCNNAGKLCSFDDIALNVWSDPSWSPGNNTISRAVGNLRKKLNLISPGSENYIQNIRGQGYKIVTN